VDFIERKNSFAKVKLKFYFISDTFYNPFGVKVEELFGIFVDCLKVPEVHVNLIALSKIPEEWKVKENIFKL